MYLALATDAACGFSHPLPTLCGVYARKADADAYVQWENERSNDSVYYVIDAAECAVHSEVADDAGDMLRAFAAATQLVGRLAS